MSLFEDLTQGLKEIEEYAKATNNYAILKQPKKIIVRPADFPGKSDSEIKEVVDSNHESLPRPTPRSGKVVVSASHWRAIMVQSANSTTSSACLHVIDFYV